jgi:hypothetical protein
MSKLNITYYKQLNDIQLTSEDIDSNYCDICFNVTDRTCIGDAKTSEDTDHVIDLTDFSVTITEKNNKFSVIKFPPVDCVIKSTDQFFLFSERICWSADDVISFTVKIGDLEKEFTFTVPRPAQTYPSWTWSNGQWNAPVAYPDDGVCYDWNESTLSWEKTNEEN